MSKILVTGGLGYIGSHTVVELHKSGHDIVIIDDLSNSSLKILDGINEIINFNINFIELDLKNFKQTKSFIKENIDIDGVIHFAASKAVGESVEDPLKYYTNNISSLLNLLNALKSLERKINFIFSSSATVYGKPEILPITENESIKVAESPYGNTKQIGEEILFDLVKSSPYFNVISLRYFNPIGAHNSALIGELPIGVPQNLVPFITQTAIGKREILTIFGNDYDTHDGTCLRDYIHVVDLANAHLKALSFLIKKKENNYFDTFNIGTGKASSVLELIKGFEESTGINLNYKIGDRRIGDVDQCFAEVSKANNVLNWKSNLTIEDALVSAWNWEKNINNEKF
ncbi:MAG: UDP-glucose 4-epimerase GalE [Flavobacteriaceae bacterium]|nr:UDP-glucose 4-epimerase GalE [Flavobacteriaceae bacterium]